MSLMGAYTKDAMIHSRDELRALPLPQPQGPWHQPVPFVDFIDLIDDEISRAGLRVASEEHFTLKDGMRHFGVLTVTDGYEELGGDGWTMMLGIRGAHDRSMSRGISFGRHVTVCSNGMFTGELGRFFTKQTSHIWDRLRELVRRGIDRIPGLVKDEQDKIERMMMARLALGQGDHILAHVFREGGLSAQQLGHALKEWEVPTFDAHLDEGRNLWLVEQAVTQAVKPAGTAPVSPMVLAEKTQIANRVIADYLPQAA